MELKYETLENSINKIGFGKFQIILIVICCFLESCVSTETMLLSFLGPVLTCQWMINIVELPLLTTSLFIGLIFGVLIFGKLCDQFGRKPIMLISSVCTLYIGILCALTPTIEWLILLRCFIGFSSGGINVSLFTLVTELLSSKQRGNLITVLLGSWVIGEYYVITNAYFIIPIYGWRWFLLISILPFMIITPFVFWIPESPRFLLLNNRKNEAVIILNKMAKLNNSVKIIDVDEAVKVNSSIKDLLHKKYLSTTFITFYIWFTDGLTYYGIILLISQINEFPRQCIRNFNFINVPLLYQSNSSNDNSCCLQISWQTIKDSYISTTGELIFMLITFILINMFGRKLCLFILSLIVSVCFLLLNVCMPSVALSILLLILRGSAFIVYNLAYIYTEEVFPTTVRSIGFGICNSAAKLGGILSSFVVNILMIKYSLFTVSLIFFCVNIMSSISGIFLPYETKNRKLFQNADESDTELDYVMDKSKRFDEYNKIN